MSTKLVMLNEGEKNKWMNERMAKGYSFAYTKGHVEGATYSDGSFEKERNVSVTCLQTGENFRFLWG